MEVRVRPADDGDFSSVPLLAVPVFGRGSEADVPHLPTRLREAVGDARQDARGKAGHTVIANTGLESGPRRVALIGAGERGEADGEALRRFAGSAVRAAESRSLDALAVHVPPDVGVEPGEAARAVTEGALLAAWRFVEQKGVGTPEDERPTPVAAVEISVAGDGATVEEGVRVGRAVAGGQNFARALQFRPGNVATPTHLGEASEEMAKEVGLEAEVFGPRRILKEEMHALMAVNRGSDEEARFIVLRHNGGPKGDPPLVLVGKGLTFDAGGISIKPAKGMEDMKYDMSGGAAVLGAMRAVGELRLPVNVVGLVPSTENLISGKALKPGDVIPTRAGKTVEVVNTDAEGRLILADALAYAADLSPRAVVDLATLTGAVVVGLGHHAAAVLGTDDDLVEELRRAGERTGERCWPLPLWDDYRSQLDSDAADLKNVGGRPAGTITAAMFLRQFAGDAPWAHLDIAGTAYGTEPLPYQRKGGYGFPVRLLVEWVRSRSG